MSRVGALAGRLRDALERMAPHARGRLFRKYAIPLVALVGGALTVNAAIEAYYSYHENRQALVALQREKAQGAAAVIEQFVKEIEGQLGWTTHASVTQGAAGTEQRRFEFLRLLRQAPAITEVAWIDPQGREQIRVSRLAMDVIGSGADFSQDRKFNDAKANKRYVSPVYFRKESEPYLTLALAGAGRSSGVAVAEVNLKFIWDVVSRIRVGSAGAAYVVDERGFLIAHPDIGLVLRKTDLSGLDQVAAALARLKEPSPVDAPPVAHDRTGRQVLAAAAPIPALRWLVFVEQPLAEAFLPIYQSLWRSGLVLTAGLALAALAGLWLAQRMVVPIRALADGAARIGGGDLDHRIELSSGDEVQALADGFNEMGARLKESYEGLERKVEERTRELHESLEHQTATSKILSVISGSPGKVEPVFDTILRSARELCAAEFGHLLFYNGKTWHAAALHNVPQAYADWWNNAPVVAGPETNLGRVQRTGRPDQVVDVRAGKGYAARTPLGIATVELGGARTLLSVPLLKEGTVIGALALYRSELRAFDDKQVALLSSFADQAVIAIENTRLFSALEARTRELQESLEYQTATSDVLNVISRSPSQLQPVLDTIVATAAHLCQADFALIFKLEAGNFHLAAISNADPEFVDYLRDHPPPPGRGTTTGRAALERRSVHTPDVLADPEDDWPEGQKIGKFRTNLGVPLLRDGAPIGVITLVRSSAVPFTAKQKELVTTFADQAVIAIENVRLFEEVQARTAQLTEALEYQTATSDVLGVISRSPNELQPVLDCIVETAATLCSAEYALIAKCSATQCVFAAANKQAAADMGYLAQSPVLIDRGSITGRVAFERRTVHVHDVLSDPEYKRQEWQAISKQRTVLGVPLMRKGALLGVIIVARTAVAPFTAKQVDLVSTFADQAVIAIENVRLFEEVQARTRELTEALEQQTATSEVLGVISSSPGELEPVFHAMLENATRICDAKYGILYRYEDGAYSAVAKLGVPPAYDEFLKRGAIRPGPATGLGRLIATKQTVHVADTLAEQAYVERDSWRVATAELGGIRTFLNVPMLKDNQLIGAIGIYRGTVRPFSHKQIELVTGFANQAVIAIENVRLLNELRARTRELQESLEYQTATGEVLNVISRSPSQIQPVLDAIVQTAARLCGADHATIFRLEDGRYHLAAGDRADAEFTKYLALNPIPPGRESLVGRAALERRTVHIPDALADPEYTWFESQRIGKFRTMLGIPLLRHGEPIGVIAMVHTEVKPFTDKQVELVTTFADQAVIAIENARLFEEVQARTRELSRSLSELKSLSDVSRAVSSSLDLKTVLRAILEHACDMSDSGGGAIYVLDAAKGEFSLEAGLNMGEEFIAEVREHPIRVGDTLVGETAERREAIQIDDLAAAPPHPLFEMHLKAGVRALLAIPLLHQDDVIGALVVRRKRVGSFSPEIVNLLQAFASQSSLAIYNARLFHEIEVKSHQLVLASQHKSQFLANMSHELRTPLNAILGYAELIQDGVYGDLADKPKAVLERVQANGKHLLGLINDVLDLSKIEAGQLTLRIDDYSMSNVVQTVVAATESLAAEKRLPIRTDIDGGLPLGLGDERRLSQVLLNLVGNAIKFTDAGEIRVAATSSDGRFRVKVSDTGPGIPESEQERIFEEFHQIDSSNTKTKSGTGLGLAIAKRIIELHGGQIWVDSHVGKGSTFHVELPVKAEQRVGAA